MRRTKGKKEAMRIKMEEKDGKRKTGRMEKSQRREERNSAEGRRAEEEKCSAVIVETYKKRISSFFPSSTSLHCPHTQQHILYCTLLNVSQSRGQLAVLSRFVLSPLSESTVCVFFSALKQQIRRPTLGDYRLPPSA